MHACHSSTIIAVVLFLFHNSQYNPTLSVYLLTLLHPDILLWKYISMFVILDSIKSSLLCIEAISSREPNYLLSHNVIFSVVSRTSPASDPIPQDPRLSKVICQMSNVRIFFQFLPSLLFPVPWRGAEKIGQNNLLLSSKDTRGGKVGYNGAGTNTDVNIINFSSMENPPICISGH